jgi:hypothetical protein
MGNPAENVMLTGSIAAFAKPAPPLSMATQYLGKVSITEPAPMTPDFTATINGDELTGSAVLGAGVRS